MNLIFPILLCAMCVPVLSNELIKTHLKKRNALIEEENKRMLGSDIKLNEKEKIVNQKIMMLKNNIIREGYLNPRSFNYSKHFFTYKEEVKHLPLYKILKAMPKGALLHAHESGLIDADYIVNITYWDNLWVCFVREDIEFSFSKYMPVTNCDSSWKLMREVRSESNNVESFDARIRKHFTIVIDNPTEVYTDINTVWNKFQQYFYVTTPLLSYKPAWEYYLYQTMKEFRHENIMYIELRTVLTQLYDIDGRIYDAIETAEVYKEVVDKFIVDFPDFIGLKIIYAPMRGVNAGTVAEYIDTVKLLNTVFPDFIAGFDLVGQEDLGQPLKKFLPQLTEAAAQKIPLFFHAGETNWYGTSTDENLIDAIVLGTRRIGHAYALSKYPVLMDEVKRKDIAIEVNVVSNAILGLVSDVRNHPLASYLARGLPVVLSSDNPGVWGADPITHDFFVSFVGISSKHADLKLLKKLVLNSLKYSTVANKTSVLKEFEKRWSIYIDEMMKYIKTL